MTSRLYKFYKNPEYDELYSEYKNCLIDNGTPKKFGVKMLNRTRKRK